MISLAGAQGEPCGSCKTEWFNQTLDHFKPIDNRTWKQKYFSNDEFFDWDKKTGPVFLLIGGENPIDINQMSGFHWHDVAKQQGALMYELEHRFYGESWPLGEDSLTTENLRYLSSQQALEDIANFIKTKNKKHKFKRHVKWVTWGGSYGGNLATWSRVKYQGLIFAAITSSAPLLSKVEYPEYFQVVYEAIEGHSKKCAVEIKKAMDETKKLMISEKGMEQLNKDYTLCQRLTKESSKKDITNFYYNVIQMLAVIVQYNLETIVPQWSQITLEICDVMTNKSVGSRTERLNHIVTKNKQVCIFYQYDATIKFWKNTDIKSDSAGQRTWMYQKCTEFGNLQTTSKTPLFQYLIDTDFILGECEDTFGKNFGSESVYAAVNKTNTEYGGLDVETERITSTHGSFDPWYPLGITKSKNKDSPAFLIKRTSHCQDQFSNRWDDLPEMTQTRNTVAEKLKKWLSGK